MRLLDAIYSDKAFSKSITAITVVENQLKDAKRVLEDNLHKALKAQGIQKGALLRVGKHVVTFMSANYDTGCISLRVKQKKIWTLSEKDPAFEKITIA